MAEKTFDPKSALVTSEEREIAKEGESLFLKYQDKNGDKLPDICDVDVVPAQNICKDCVPNPLAITKNWKKSDQSGPFLNEKICKYQISFVTGETSTGFTEGMSEAESDLALEKIFEKYANDAAEFLLREFNKDTGPANLIKLTDNFEHTSYYLEARNFSRLKLLYSIDFTKFQQLADEEFSAEDDEPEEAEDIKVTYETTNMGAQTIRTRKAIALYGRFAKVGAAVEGKKVRFTDSNKIFKLSDYGDAALFTERSPVGDALMELEKFLNGRGYQIPGVVGPGFFRGFGDDKVIKLDFVLSSKYKLKKLKVYTESCGTNRPDVVYGRRKLKGLNFTEAWKDPTAVAFFMKIKEIDQAASAREPMPYEDFIKKFTYPPVFVESAKLPGEDTNTIASCITDSLRGDFKELGQDIFDEVFSLADAVAYKFHKNLCQTDPNDVDEDALTKGLNLGIAPDDPQNIYALAKMQAFDTVTAEDSAFAQMCFRMISMGASGSACGLSPIQQLDQMYAEGFDRLGVCGLMDLLLEALQCLFKGLTLEQALASILRAALNAMGVTQIGELFVGLPPEKQLELERLVNQKLESGDIFPPDSPGQATSDIASRKQSGPDPVLLGRLSAGDFKGKKPWDDEKFVESQEKNMRPDNYGNMTPSKYPNSNASGQRQRRTIGQKLQSPLGEEFKANNIILDAYIQAFLEAYQDNYLELLDLLNKFPGAQLIASIIAFLDCPTPPLFNPGFDDFFKSLQLPFCRNTAPITFPKWENPFLYIPKLTDILAAIFAALIKLVFCLVMKILILIMAKICEIIADAICKLLETAGQIGVGLLTGNANVREIIRSTICGPNASDETIDDTILELMDNFGVGGAAFADPERTQSFFGDFINSSTREETLNMFVDGPTRAQLDIVNGLLDNEYQEFREALPNSASIESMIKNISNVIPSEIFNEMRDARALGSDALDLPMNPTLCATPEALESFEQARCDLLAGRMSPEQCRQQNIQARDQILDDLGDLEKLMHDGVQQTLENSLPPIFSDPGCDNGLLPFEPEESIKTATGALKGDLESLQISYTDDMLGNGGLFSGDDDWGFMNMILSDTLGNPYTAHQRKTSNNSRFVDFYVPSDVDKVDDELNFPSEKRQKGAYPYYVAEWLKYQLDPDSELANDLTISFDSNNSVEEKKVFRKTFDDLGFKGLFDTDVNVTEIPDYGYNIDIDLNFETEIVKLTQKARKETPDTILRFKDNAKGYRSEGRSEYAYGFRMECYYSDIEEIDNENASAFFNIYSDNVRIKIVESVNTAAKSFSDAQEAFEDDVEDERGESDSKIVSDTTFEFFAVDDTLDDIDINERAYPQLLDALTGSAGGFSPPVAALSDLAGLDMLSARSIYNNTNQEMFDVIRRTVADNKPGEKDRAGVWLYGAKFDDIVASDLDYGITLTQRNASDQDEKYRVGDFVPYDEYRVPEYDDDGNRDDDRSIRNDDSILGISRNAHNNRDNPENIRVHYLDPTQFGQSYKSPSFYIKPVTNKGWLGAINLMFPEYTPCKPRSTNLIAFDEIKEHIDSIYSRIPEDERLKSDPDCVLEVPYNRILGRPARAGLESVITAMIRIFASTHFVKSLPVFGTFSPRFPQNYSNIYASYIVESMEDACLDAGNNFLNPFKDNEFWYAFLEQAVQVYSRRLDDDQDESITPDNVPNRVKEAIEKINKLQDRYNQPSRDEFKDAPDGEKGIFQSLKSYREEKILEAVRETEESAKIILTELVKEQLSRTSEIFKENLKKAGFKTIATDLDYYFIQNLVAGGSDLNLTNAVEFVETVIDEPGEIVEGDKLYTHGNEFALVDGTPYIGYFHKHIDESDNEIFMVGEEHTMEQHAVLVPFAKNVDVKAKDYDGVLKDFDISDQEEVSDRNFYIKKYVSIDGEQRSVSSAEGHIRGLAPESNISNFYPGDMSLKRDDKGRIIGIEGQLGVRHGLSFGVIEGSTRREITNVEISALDLKVKEFAGPKANSKLLLCLLQNLKDDPRFRMTVDYIFSMRKALSIMAIYTDMAFMPSIGEYTQGDGSKNNNIDGFSKPASPGAPRAAQVGGPKPGVFIKVVDGKIETDYNLGWAHESERNGFFASPFYRKWDEWDQVLLRKSTKRVKKIFQPYYTKRKFEVEDPDSDSMGPGEMFLAQTKSRFTPIAGGRIVPWFKKKKLKPNPFNSKGQLCKKRN